MSENSVENEVVRRRPYWLVPLVAGVCVVALAGGVTGGVIAWRDGNARALADAQSRCECSLAKVDETRKTYAKMVESAGGMKAVKAEQVADASAARRSPPTCSPAGSPAGRAPAAMDTRGPVPRAPEQAVSWAASHGGADGPAHRSGHGARRIGLVYATGAGECGMPSPGRHGRRPVRQRHGPRTPDGAYRTRARPAAQALPRSEGPGIGDVPAGLVAGTRSARTGPRAAGQRNGPKPSIMQAKRRKPPHYKSGTKKKQAISSSFAIAAIQGDL